MEEKFNEYFITDRKELLQIDVIINLLNTTYWGKTWSQERIERSINNSVCFGVFFGKRQIAYARCVTDFSTMYWLCDVIVEEEFRKKGIASALIQYIVNHNSFKGLMGILSSNHSKELYKKFGFKLSTNGFMLRSAKFDETVISLCKS